MLYVVDTNHIGIDRSDNVPQKITLKTEEAMIIDLDIDTGIR
jgi:hypothetical protein